jgi:hypothetical protein
MDAGLVKGEGFAVDASIIKADAMGCLFIWRTIRCFSPAMART